MITLVGKVRNFSFLLGCHFLHQFNVYLVRGISLGKDSIFETRLNFSDLFSIDIACILC